MKIIHVTSLSRIWYIEEKIYINLTFIKNKIWNIYAYKEEFVPIISTEINHIVFQGLLGECWKPLYAAIELRARNVRFKKQIYCYELVLNYSTKIKLSISCTKIKWRCQEWCSLLDLWFKLKLILIYAKFSFSEIKTHSREIIKI